VIIATGGMAMPVSGSDGNGYKLAKEFGHSINTPTPALVQLKLESDKLKAMDGV
jgi:Predicted flavoproteins